MQLWQRLYNMVWLATVASMVFPRWFGKYSAVVHVGLGIALLVLARRHATLLSTMPVPDRVKRISKAVFSTATIIAVVGVVFGGLKHYPGIPGWAGSIGPAGGASAAP